MLTFTGTPPVLGRPQPLQPLVPILGPSRRRRATRQHHQIPNLLSLAIQATVAIQEAPPRVPLRLRTGEEVREVVAADAITRPNGEEGQGP